MYTLIIAVLIACCQPAFSSELEAPRAVAGHGQSTCLVQRKVQIKASPLKEVPVQSVSGPSSVDQWSDTVRQVSLDAAGAATLARRTAMTWASGVASDIFGEEKDRRVQPAGADGKWSRLNKMQLAAFVAFLILFDLVVLQRLAVSGLGNHLLLVGFWVVIALGYNLVIWNQKGTLAGVEWFTGYILEWLLSMDNLFVFHLIFRVFATPKKALHKALMFGLIGAVISRLVFFMMVSTLLSFVSWFRLIFGGFLIYSGIQAAQDEGDDDESMSETMPVRFLRCCLGKRLLECYEDEDTPSLIVWREGKLHFTMLLPVIASLEITDIVFALDSVSAKAAQIPDYWISCSSSILAMFGLRAMFFVVQDLVDLFDTLKYGLCFILVFIGIELMISDYVLLPPQVVLVVILAVFIISIASSSSIQITGRKGDAQGVLESASAKDRSADQSQDTDSTMITSPPEPHHVARPVRKEAKA